MKTLLITDYLSPHVIQVSKTMFDVTEKYDINTSDLKNIIGQFDALICRSRTKINIDVIDQAICGNLKIIVSVTSGMSHIDTQYAKEKGIKICNTPWGVTNANAEFNIGAIIALSRNLVVATDLMRQGVWDQQQVIGSELKGKKIGIISFGRIGQKTAQYASVFEMDILVYDPYVEHTVFEKEHVTPVSLEELLCQSDFIVVNVPLTKNTTNMISKEKIALIKPSAYIVQVSRGGVIDEDALIDALRERKIAGALLDVYVNEPEIDSRFKNMPNVILTPHIACSTLDTREVVGEFALREVKRHLNGEALQSEFVPSLGAD